MSGDALLFPHPLSTQLPPALRKSAQKSLPAVLVLRRTRDDEGQSGLLALSPVIPARFLSPALGTSSVYDASKKVMLPRSFLRQRGGKHASFLARP